MKKLLLSIFVFSAIAVLAQDVEQKIIKENTIAVLPVPFINVGNNQFSDADAKQAQNEIYSFLEASKKNIQPLEVMDLRTTNSLLRKANVDFKNLDEYTIEELREILGVDHILATKVTFISKAIKTSQESISGSNKSITGVSTESVSNVYTYKVFVDIYKNKDKVYSNYREPFFSDATAWKDAFEYMIKRSVIYHK